MRDELQQLIANTTRGLLALGFFVGGIYWFVVSVQAWSQEGFIVFTNGEQGKTALSGLIFSLAFILYGAMELVKLFNENKNKI